MYMSILNTIMIIGFSGNKETIYNTEKSEDIFKYRKVSILWLTLKNN